MVLDHKKWNCCAVFTATLDFPVFDGENGVEFHFSFLTGGNPKTQSILMLCHFCNRKLTRSTRSRALWWSDFACWQTSHKFMCEVMCLCSLLCDCAHGPVNATMTSPTAIVVCRQDLWNAIGRNQDFVIGPNAAMLEGFLVSELDLQLVGVGVKVVSVNFCSISVVVHTVVQHDPGWSGEAL